MAKFAVGEMVEMWPTTMRAGRSSPCFQQLTATFDTPLTRKDTARSSFSLRKN